MLNDARIGRLHELLESRQISAEELITAVLERISTLETTLNAFITITPEQALADAQAVDASIARGEAIGPLAGIPVALKDNICTEGVRTTCGSRMLEHYVPPFSAVAYERLRQAGAVLVGKSNMDEFATGTTNKNSFFGATANPWSPDHIPGGSSGASAASVAARQVCLSIGSDAGGSVRVPAAHCGVVGLKPTYGLIPTDGLAECAPSLEHLGPLTLDVTGCALALQVLTAGEDYTAYLGRDIRGLRIGIPQEYLEQADPQVRSLFDSAVQMLTGLGAEVEETSLPHTQSAPASYFTISAAEAFSNLSNFDGVRFGHRAEARHLHEMYRKTRTEGFGPDLRRRLIFGTLALSADHYEEYYLNAQKIRTLVCRDFDQAFSKFDLLLTPTVPTPPPAASLGQDELEMRLQGRYAMPANLAGIPALSLPIGFAGELPVGLQLLAPSLGEGTLLSAAYALEQLVGFYRHAPKI
ncbi:MAG: Asp-tRNA(Asn)/Glu-tRNA(Gln) amidotransferase subunit GatA [Bacillota bacterium]|nr:Asp-tRNA(Asn)/Glu-tRNA(Gln) amidotransferase subunit GatA [Bacillota bacterium]